MLAILSITIISLLCVPLITHRAKKSKENEAYNRTLEVDIIQKKEQLKNLSLNTATATPKLVNDMLDIYEKSNIRIPKDIIEDLIYMGLTNEQDIFNYIENQRHYWKLENTKKPYRKEVK